MNASENLIEVFVPVQSSAIVEILKGNEILLNGHIIYKNGQFIQNELVSFVGYDKDRLIFKVTDGKYSFKTINN